MIELITQLLTASIGKISKFNRNNTDSKVIDIAHGKTCIKTLLHVEKAILIRYYNQIVKTTGLYQSTDGPAGHPADNPPNSDGLGNFHPNCTRIYSFSVLTTQTINSQMV